MKTVRSTLRLGGCLALIAALPGVASPQPPGPKQSGPPPEAEVATTFQRAFDLLQSGASEAALPIAQRCWELQEPSRRPDDPEGASCAALLGLVYRTLGDLRAAAEHHALVLEQVEGAVGRNDERSARAQSTLAQSLWQLGEHDRATVLFTDAVATLEATLGDQAPDTLVTITFLALTLGESGRAAEALPYQRRVVSAYEELFGEEHEETATQLHLMGGLLIQAGRWEEARSSLQRALAVRETALGVDHVLTGVTLNDLGILLGELGELGEARELLERALYVSESRAPETSAANLGKSYDNLAAVTWKLGDLEAARPYAEKALAELEGALGADAVDTAIARSNLANILQSEGDLAGARAALERSLPPLLNAPDRSRAGVVLSNLSALSWLDGDLDAAVGTAEQALELLDETLGRDHPDTALALQNLATLIGERGDHERARELLEEALVVQERAGAVTQGATLANLALNAHQSGLRRETLDYLERALELDEELVLAVVATGSERETARFLERDRTTTNWAIQYHLREAPDDTRALELALTSVLRRKGRSLDATAAIRRLMQGDLNRETRDLYEYLVDLRVRRAELESSPDESADAMRAGLEEQIDWVKGEIAELSPRLAEREAVTARRVQEHIEPGSALVEITSYWPHDPDAPIGERHAPRHYVAYVLRPDALRFADLGPAGPIDSAALDFREALAETRADVLALGRALDALTFARIRPLLEGTRRLILAPDGALNLTPFAALPDEEGRYLIESFELSWVTSGRDLLSSPEGAATEEPLLVGDVAFGPLPDEIRDDGLGGLTFGRLPATRSEVEAVATTLGAAPERVLTGERASEAAVKAARSPRILHLATHGYFLGEIEQGEPTPPASLQQDRQPPLDSLTSSGLALAAFNQRAVAAGHGEDGVLSALEVVDLDLAGTEIVALSACETGLGAVRDGQGVFGLRRALVLAGSHSQLMTLWQVADEATKDLMIAWYAQLAEGAGRAEALRAVQLAALRGEALPSTGRKLGRGSRELGVEAISDPKLEGGRHPFYWAGFILSGEPGPLGER